MAYTPTYYPPVYGGYTPQAPQPQITQPPPAPQSSVNWVQGEAGAKAFMVTPGASVILMDSESDHFYMKAVDSYGMPTLRKFSYKEVGNAPPQADFVAREEFEAFKRQITELIKPEVANEQSV